jgi:Arf-GAP/coiled-coil/ANK repeat/PH domain-containing protein
LDDIDSETLSLLACLGNALVNDIYEKMIPKCIDRDPCHIVQKATPKCDNLARESWIREKYVSKSFVRLFKSLKIKITKNLNSNLNDATNVSGNYSLLIEEFRENNATNISNAVDSDKSETVSVTSPSELLHLSCAYGNVALMSYALALSADRNSKLEFEKDLNLNSLSSSGSIIRQMTINGYTPLISAVNSGSLVAVELMLLNGSKLNACDLNGQTALHHATILKDLKMVCLLLKRGADPLAVDKNNLDPIMIATENCQANIVTILRVAKMNNDLKEQDMTYSGDPMFDDILKDLLSLTAVETGKKRSLKSNEENNLTTDSSENSDHSDNLSVRS